MKENSNFQKKHEKTCAEPEISKSDQELISKEFNAKSVALKSTKREDKDITDRQLRKRLLHQLKSRKFRINNPLKQEILLALVTLLLLNF